MIRQTCLPLEARRDREDDFSGELRTTNLGPVQVASMVATPYWVQRTPRLIRQFDPEKYHLMVSLRGDGLAAQGRQETTLAPGDMVLYDTSRPMLVRSGDGAAFLQILTVTVPRDIFPLPEDMVRRLIAVRLPGSDGIRKVVGRFLLDLTASVDNCHITGSVHLGEAVLDLISAVISDRAGSLAWDSSAGRNALLTSVQMFIREHLGDPQLSPAMIAAAHFISLRSCTCSSNLRE
jgi:hypothetical protein